LVGWEEVCKLELELPYEKEAITFIEFLRAADFELLKKSRERPEVELHHKR
jgi:hypothetical protein